MRQGRARVRLERQGFDLANGQVLFVPAKFVHGFRFAKGTEGLVLSFPLAILTQGVAATKGLARHLALPLVVSLDPGIDALCGQIQTAFAATGPFRASLLIALSHALLVGLAQVAAQSGRDPQPPPAGEWPAGLYPPDRGRGRLSPGFRRSVLFLAQVPGGHG